MKIQSGITSRDMKNIKDLKPENFLITQDCPKCGFIIGALAGSVDAICKNCGFKDPCCE